MTKLRTTPNINDLEKSVLTCVLAAQRDYEAMTGHWLKHAPESFLQVCVARGVCKATGNAVYIDASMRKIANEKGRGPGRPAANAGKRPDISVWFKNSDALRAIIEIKCTHLLDHIKKDVAKMEAWLRQAGPPGAAYILAYSEAMSNKSEPISVLNKRFDRWQNETGWRRIGSKVQRSSEDPEWA